MPNPDSPATGPGSAQPHHADAQPAQGLLLILSGPSGVGKSTIARRVEQRLDATFSVSLTTRPATAKDRPGIDYHFVDEPTFQQRRDAGELLEWAQVFGHYYGTPRQPVEDAIRENRLIILEIDIQGAVQVKHAMPHALAVFILPPSEQELLHRLRERRREPEDVIEKRFAKAQAEIRRAKACNAYDAFVVNRDLDAAVEEICQHVEQRRQNAQA